MDNLKCIKNENMSEHADVKNGNSYLPVEWESRKKSRILGQ